VSSSQILKIAVAVTLIAGFGSGLLLEAEPPQAVGTWASMGTMADSRTDAASVALPDGRTLIVGGTVADGSATDSIAIFDPSDHSVSTVGQLSTARVGHTATLLKDGRILIVGGLANGLILSDIEAVDLVAGTSTPIGMMAQPRTGHAAARLTDDRVLIVGGETSDGVVLASAEIFNLETQTTTPTASPLSIPRVGATATTLIDNRVLVAGGRNGLQQDLASAELYYSFSETFDPTDTQLSVARSGHTAVLLPNNNSVLVAGGTSAGAAVATTDLFLTAEFPDPYSWGMGRFAASTPMAAARTGAAGGPATEGFTFAAGGGSVQAEKYHFATIKTDKDDYAPGERATITGSGWRPNSEVTLVFQEDPAVHEDYVLTVPTDGEGNLFWNTWAPERHDINVRFFLTAKDSSSRAQITFTDGPVIASATVGAQAGTLANGTAGSATFPVNVTRGTSNGAASLCVTTSLPTGATASFSPNPTLTLNNGNTSRPSTLTITTTASTPAGATNFTVRAFSGGTCSTTLDFAEASSTLTVTAATGTAPTITSFSSTTVTVNAAGSFTVTTTGSPTPALSVTGSLPSGVTFTNNGNGTATLAGPSALGTVGSYPLTFKAANGVGLDATQNFTLTVQKANQVAVTVTGPSSITYGSTGTATASGGSGSGTYSFSHGASTGCTVSGTTVSVTNASGTCSLTATRAGDANYGVSSTSSPFAVTLVKATPTATLAVSNSPQTYTGSGEAATVGISVSSVPGAVASILTGGAATQTAAGTYAVTANFVPTDTNNYNTLTGLAAGNFVINKATPTATLAVSNSPQTYTGSGQAATVGISLSSAPGAVANILTGGAATQTAAGTYAVTANFVPTDTANFNTLTGLAAGNFVINKATPTATLAVSNSPQTYDGSAKAATVSISASSIPGSVTNILTGGTATKTNAGTYAVTADFVPTDTGNYNSLPGLTAGNFTINKGTPTATLAVNNSPQTYTASGQAAAVGISLSSVSGAMANILTGGAATQTTAGTYAVTADFVPTDATNYNSLLGVSAGNFTINKATPTATLAVSNSPQTYDASPKAATVALSASSVAGAVANIVTGGAATQTSAGTYAVTADFVPTDTANYNSLPGLSAGNFAIDKAMPTATLAVSNSPQTYTGAGQVAAVGISSSSVAGAVANVLTGGAATQTNAGTYAVTADFVPTDTTNYNSLLALSAGNFTIDRATPTATLAVSNSPLTYDASAKAAAVAVSISSVPGAAANILTGGAAMQTNAGTYAVTADFVPTDTTNYNSLPGLSVGNFTIDKATASIDADGYTGVYDAAAHGATVASATGVGGADLSASVTLGGETFTNVPGGTATWSFSNANYVAQTGSATIVINPATATIAVTGFTGVYDAAAHGATLASATGVGGADLSGSVTLGGETFTNVPGGTATWSFSNLNYTSDSGTAAIEISKADATILVAGYSGVYDAAAHGATLVSASGVSGDLTGSVTMGGQTFTEVPGGLASWSFSHPNYNAQSNAAVTIEISKASSTTTVTCSVSEIYTGLPIAPCTAAVTGAGSLNQSLLVSYTDNTNVGPADASASYAGDDNHTGSSDTDTFAITKAGSATTVTCPTTAQTYDGTLLTPCTAEATGVAISPVTLSVTHSANRNVGTAGASAAWGGDANHTGSSDTDSFSITKRSITVTAATGTKVYDGIVISTGLPTITGSLGSGDSVIWTQTYNDKDVPYATTLTPAGTVSDGNGGTNYSVTFNTALGSITPKSITGSVTANNKPYDGNTSATIATRSLAGVVSGDTVSYVGGTATFDNATTGTGKTVTGTGLGLSGAHAANYTADGSATTTANITVLATRTSVSGPPTVPYSDGITLSATVTADYGGTLAGTVEFKIGTTSYGTVSLPANGLASQTVTKLVVVNQPVATYEVNAIFASTSTNHTGSSAPSYTLIVRPEHAAPVSGDSAYTGELFAWTPTASSNTATLTLGATIMDVTADDAGPWPGNIATAKVTFAFRDSSGKLTPINGAQNLSVGLVNPLDKTVGTAAATLQFSLNSNDICTYYTVAVLVSGNYNMPTPTWQDKPISICRATPGSIISNPAALMNAATSNGYLAGSSAVQFDVKYNKAGTNPQGKVKLTITSDRNAAGLVDGKTHTYVVTTNAISTLSVKLPNANFSAKANVAELVTNPDSTVTAVGLDSGTIVQLALTDSSTDTLSVQVSRSNGGLWFSSGWNGVKTVERAILNNGAITITP